MTTITNKTLIFKPMFVKPIVENHTFFTVITFSSTSTPARISIL